MNFHVFAMRCPVVAWTDSFADSIAGFAFESTVDNFVYIVTVAAPVAYLVYTGLVVAEVVGNAAHLFPVQQLT